MKWLISVFCCATLLSCRAQSQADSDAEVAEGNDLSDSASERGPRTAGDRYASMNIQAAKTRWVEVGLVMDNALYRKLSGLAEAKAAAAEILRQADWLYQNARAGLAQPAVRLRLVQLTILTDADPWVVPANEAGVVNPHKLRDAFGAWAQVHFKDNDVRHLLTGLNLGSPLGVANLSTVCTAKSVSVSRPAFSPSDPDWISTHARTAAHEIGHNLGLRHDGVEAFMCRIGCADNYELFAETRDCDNSDFVMGPGGNLWTSEFSECSQYQLHIITTLGEPDRLGPYEGVPQCLLDPPSSCEDDPQAECSLTDPCCDNDCKIIASSQGLVCRPEAHSECDTAEICNGSTADCPADIYSPVGETCGDTADDAGSCYLGECRSYARACAQFDSGFFKYTPCPEEQVDQPCGDLWCIKPPMGACGRFLQPGYLDKYTQVPDGTLCSTSGDQCLGGICTSP